MSEANVYPIVGLLGKAGKMMNDKQEEQLANEPELPEMFNCEWCGVCRLLRNMKEFVEDHFPEGVFKKLCSECFVTLTNAPVPLFDVPGEKKEEYKDQSQSGKVIWDEIETVDPYEENMAANIKSRADEFKKKWDKLSPFDDTTELKKDITAKMENEAKQLADIIIKTDTYENLGASVGRLVAEKQKAYGDSFGRSGNCLREMYPDGVKPDQLDDMLVIARILDKLFRIASEPDYMGESPFRDIAGYSLLGLKKHEDVAIDIFKSMEDVHD